MGTHQPDGTILYDDGRIGRCPGCGGTKLHPLIFVVGRRMAVGGTSCALECKDASGWLYDMEPHSAASEMILPADSASRKETPLTTGLLDYFPLAAAGVARVSKKGNDKHNPGQPLHWARGKSTDHADCIARHLVDRDAIDPDSGEPHYLCLAWRALAYAEEMEEKRLGKGPSRGSR